MSLHGYKKQCKWQQHETLHVLIFPFFASHLELGQRSKQYTTACSINVMQSSGGISLLFLRSNLARC